MNSEGVSLVKSVLMLLQQLRMVQPFQSPSPVSRFFFWYAPFGSFSLHPQMMDLTRFQQSQDQYVPWLYPRLYGNLLL